MAGKKDLTKYLNQLSKEELIKEVEKLFQKLKPVQEYYSLELGTDSLKLLSDYKKKLEKVFRVTFNHVDPSMSEANRIIKEFSQVSVYIIDTIDLMLYKVELSVNLFEEWGHEFTGVVNSFGTTYHKVIDLIRKNNLYDHFRERCNAVESHGLNYELIAETL